MFPNLYFIVALLGAGAIVGAGPTYYIVHMNNKVETQNLQLQISRQQTVSVTASLDKLQSFIGAMNVASTDFQKYIGAANRQYAELRGSLDAVSKNKPLPLDCRPTPDRLQIVKSAVDAANAYSAPSP